MALTLLVEILFGLLVVSFCAIYVFLKRRYNYWKRRGVTGPEPILIFGNSWTLFTLQQTEAELIHQIYNEFPNERYVGFYYLWNPVLLIRDVSLLKAVTISDFQHFTDHPQSSSGHGTDAILSSIFFMKGEAWKVRRQALTRLFTPLRIKEHSVEFKGQIQHVLENLRAQQGKPQDVVHFFDRYSANFVVSSFYGLDIFEDEAMNNKFLELADVFVHPPKIMVVKFLFYSVAPYLYDSLRLRTYPSKLWEFYSKLTESLLDSRKDPDTRKDLITVLKKLMTEGIHSTDNERKMDFNEAVAHVFVWFAAAHHTTAITLCYILYRLSAYPDVQDKVYEELNQELKEEEVSYEHLKKLKYLDCVVKESMRLEPLLGVLKRICTQEYMLDGKLKVSKGTEIFIPAYSMQRDPKNYHDPETFYPERFADGEPSQAYMPFGIGPRICIGTKFAEVMMRMLLAAILREFRVELADRTPIKYDPNTLFITNRPQNPVWISFIPRRQK